MMVHISIIFGRLQMV